MTFRRRELVITGILGLTAAILVGIGEDMLQFIVGGDYADPSYAYFGKIDPNSQTMGHFISVLAAPLYLVGYWHLSRMLEPASKRWSLIFFLVGAYAFVVGTAWMGGRINLALTVHEIQAGNAGLTGLLEKIAAHNEPLINVPRVAMVLLSIIWVPLILTGKTRYPKIMVLANPAIILGSIFSLYFSVPAIGVYILPAALNVTHFVIFSLSLWFAFKTKNIS